MPRLKTIRPRVQGMASRIAPASTASDQRMAGRKLQARRLRIWSKDPHCAACGRLTSYPLGFHLDHIIALTNGGQDTDDNVQVLCLPCHEDKTKADLSERRRRV